MVGVVFSFAKKTISGFIKKKVKVIQIYIYIYIFLNQKNLALLKCTVGKT